MVVKWIQGLVCINVNYEVLIVYLALQLCDLAVTH